MGVEKETWFHRNRGFLMGFCIIVVILNIVIWLVVPTQTPYQKSGTVTEYKLDDEAYAVERAYRIDGTITRAAFGKPEFDGTFYVEGMDGLEEDMTLTLTREDGLWRGSYRDAAGQLLSTAVMDIEADKNFENIAVMVGDYSREGDQVTVTAPLDAARFFCIDAENRTAAVYRFKTIVLKNWQNEQN